MRHQNQEQSQKALAWLSKQWLPCLVGGLFGCLGPLQPNLLPVKAPLIALVCALLAYYSPGRPWYDVQNLGIESTREKSRVVLGSTFIALGLVGLQSDWLVTSKDTPHLFLAINKQLALNESHHWWVTALAVFSLLIGFELLFTAHRFRVLAENERKLPS